MPDPFYSYIRYDFLIHSEDNIFNKPEFDFFFHRVKWFLLISNNSLQHKYSLLFTQFVISLNIVFSLNIVECKNSSTSNNSILRNYTV